MSNLLLINSKERESSSTSSSDFHIELKKPIQGCYVYLISAHIPNTFYNITSSNNKIRWSYGATPTSTSATIPDGAYAADDLASQLQTLMDADVGDTNTYSVSYDSTTFKFTFSRASGSNDFRLDFSNSDTPYYILGFANSNTALDANDKTSSSVANLHPYQHIFIHIDEFKDDLIIPINTTSGNIQEIYLNNSYTQTTELRYNNYLRHLHVKLQDQNHNDISLNGADFSILLGIKPY